MKPELDAEIEGEAQEIPWDYQYAEHTVSFRSKDVILANGELWRVELVTYHTGHRECNRIGLNHTPWDGTIPF